MKNYGIRHFQNANIENFTSEKGMDIRKKINVLLRPILKATIKGKLTLSQFKEPKKMIKALTKGGLIIDNYPKLEKDEPYIFVSLHNFVDDTMANLATIDRNAYLLFGTTDQLEVNPEMYAAWLNGFIYVDREDKENRKDSLLKMKKVLDNGNSVLIFAEGGLNNTENLFCQKLFASPYILSKMTGAKVVPIAPLYEFGSDTIYMNVGDPIDLSIYEDKKEALLDLRDILSTLLYESLLKHSEPMIRSELGAHPRLDFMEQRRQEYMKTKWTKDVWEEELTRYLDKKEIEYNKAEESMDNIKITSENASIMGHILVKRLEAKKYNFKNYMHENWNK